MPITFQLNEDGSYCASRWEGMVENDEIVSAYESFLEHSHIDKIYREYADFSDADLSLITSEGLKRLSRFIREYCQSKGITDARCASYIPRPINHGLLQLYDFLSKSSPEETRVFTNRQAALRWLGVEEQ